MVYYAYAKYVSYIHKSIFYTSSFLNVRTQRVDIRG